MVLAIRKVTLTLRVLKAVNRILMMLLTIKVTKIIILIMIMILIMMVIMMISLIIFVLGDYIPLFQNFRCLENWSKCMCLDIGFNLMW